MVYKKLKERPGWNEWLELDTLTKTPEQWVPIAERLAEENGGILPTPKSLGIYYHGMVQAIRKFPDRFTHIKKNWGGGKPTIDEIVTVAERLAQEHNGTLPHERWLRKNGHTRIVYAMDKSPESFTHIKMACRRGKSLEEWRLVAERLAKENGGELPRPSWLYENGYSGLASALLKQPSLFSHMMPPKKRTRSLNDWIVFANQLVKRKGALPSRVALKRSGLDGLNQMISKYPDKFAHIVCTRIVSNRSPEEWVSIAEKIATQNGGILPPQKELDGALAAAIRRHRKLFENIRQDNKRLKPREWIPIAERLAEENGGILPNPKWLRVNGYAAMQLAIQRNEKLFKHIGQKKLRKRT